MSVIVALMIFNLLLIAAAFTLSSFNPGSSLKAAFIFMEIFFILVYFNIQCFEYDSSGEVISVKSYHPLLKTSERRTEFPKDKLRSFNVSNHYDGVKLNLYLNSYKEYPVHIQYIVHGLSKKHKDQLKESLQKTVTSNS